MEKVKLSDLFWILEHISVYLHVINLRTILSNIKQWQSEWKPLRWYRNCRIYPMLELLRSPGLVCICSFSKIIAIFFPIPVSAKNKTKQNKHQQQKRYLLPGKKLKKKKKRITFFAGQSFDSPILRTLVSNFCLKKWERKTSDIESTIFVIKYLKFSHFFFYNLLSIMTWWKTCTCILTKVLSFLASCTLVKGSALLNEGCVWEWSSS